MVMCLPVEGSLLVVVEMGSRREMLGFPTKPKGRLGKLEAGNLGMLYSSVHTICVSSGYAYAGGLDRFPASLWCGIPLSLPKASTKATHIHMPIFA